MPLVVLLRYPVPGDTKTPYALLPLIRIGVAGRVVRAAAHLVEVAVVRAVQRPGGAVRGHAGRTAGRVDVARLRGSGLRGAGQGGDAGGGERYDGAHAEQHAAQTVDRGTDGHHGAPLVSDGWSEDVGTVPRSPEPGHSAQAVSRWDWFG